MKNMIAIAGLGFGDEGKGTICDYLSRVHNASGVIRYNGGPQAAHHVVDPELGLHCFAQFGSGTFAGAKTYLSSFMAIDPIRLLDEADYLSDKGMVNPLDRLTIDSNCLIVTPIHAAMNQIKEAGIRNGSCGMGVGETFKDSRRLGEIVLRAGDLKNPIETMSKLRSLLDNKLAAARHYETPKVISFIQKLEKIEADLDLLVETYLDFSQMVKIQDNPFSDLNTNNSLFIFEGAQGALLDETRGFMPHVTKSDTSFNQAQSLAKEKLNCLNLTKLGILRAYNTRHGAGPFVSEDQCLSQILPDDHNQLGDWQGSWRVGWLDLLATNYALSLTGKVDSIALTNLDRLFGLEEVKAVLSYEYLGTSTEKLNKYFYWNYLPDGRIEISAFKSNVVNLDNNLAKLLFQCRPLECAEFRGFDDLAGAESYLSFIETALNHPISIVSTGPKWTDKIERNKLN